MKAMGKIPSERRFRDCRPIYPAGQPLQQARSRQIAGTVDLNGLAGHIRRDKVAFSRRA
jgi:hypothetical protein